MWGKSVGCSAQHLSRRIARSAPADLSANSVTSPFRQSDCSAEALLDSGVVDVLDIDTRQLSDGTVILMHDEYLDRTTDHTGPASNHTADTWRNVMLDTGDHPPEQAPTLAEYLDAIGGRAVITLEAKDSAAVPRIIEIIRTWNLEDSVLINTNDPAVARDIHLAGTLSHL